MLVCPHISRVFERHFGDEIRALWKCRGIDSFALMVCISYRHGEYFGVVPRWWVFSHRGAACPGSADGWLVGSFILDAQRVVFVIHVYANTVQVGVGIYAGRLPIQGIFKVGFPLLAAAILTYGQQCVGCSLGAVPSVVVE